MGSNIRNFSIIAHIDHGKSTLADRFLEIGGLRPRIAQEQILDSNPIERERGITIKLAPVHLQYHLPENLISNLKFQISNFNLIDTPGHVDFSYEVSRALAACEGAILLVDAARGVQAQTLAHADVAKRLGLSIIPVINKIDLENANIEKTTDQLHQFFGFDRDQILNVSAKTGQGLERLLEEIVTRVPCPKGSSELPLRALVFNSVYDSHRGVVAWVRIFDGNLETASQVKLLAGNVIAKAEEVGYFELKSKAADALSAGEVGYIVLGLKDIKDVKVGDTITITDQKDIVALPGYKTPKPMVYLSLYPLGGENFLELRSALEKLALSDSSLVFTPESSPVLGQGFRCGFLGLLHADITQERLEREFSTATFATAPSVPYELHYKNGETKTITSAKDYPDPTYISGVYEPVMQATIVSPDEFLGAIMTLAQDKRGTLLKLDYIGSQIKAVYEIPLSELIIDFADRLKSVSRGYASMDYEFNIMKPVELAKLDVVIAGDIVDSLSQLVVKNKAPFIARKIAAHLKVTIPQHNFAVSIQISAGGKILAREDVKAFRKDVIAKLSGGDQRRKIKLLEKQKKGKARMKQFGRVTLPQEVFINLLKS
jgi:GTP-binding protein LepA